MDGVEQAAWNLKDSNILLTVSRPFRNVFYCVLCFVVPAAVGNLSLGHGDTSELSVAWSPAPGDVDHYEVQVLFNDTRVYPSVTLGNAARGHRLSSLTPGRLYKIVVSTFSGPYQRPQFIEGRTGQWTVPRRTGNTPANKHS